MRTDNGVVPILVTLGHLGDDSLQLRFPPEHSDEILKLLDEHRVDHNTAAEFSADPTDWIEVVKVLGIAAGSVGGLQGLAKVITAFVRRHDDKRFVFTKDGESVDAKGYSQRAVEAMLEKMPQEQAELDAATRRAMGIDNA
ncbi:hypothetical protein ITJ55_13855 [Frigoribacterium sp. VKM Ac-1396]|uniref:hypothetical protein n=1 Tax=Frigoribacterium sp. VKM Ac-1396 TaxID=2783821 RepID=UPI00188BBFDC|nr:hypothetical protein [Frigoribacterium sp. VKM Ac-1396]MBF4601896.1 hypothetical protein [Frigoribacterium sp. VKM Ac-1396]